MDILKTPHRFFSSKFYSLTRALGFQAQLMAQPLTENTGYFLLARRMLKLDADSPIMGGEVVRSSTGKLYITQAHATSELNNVGIYKTLRAYEVTDVFDVKTIATVKDPILGKPIAAAQSTVWKAGVHMVIESTALEHDGFRNLTPVYRILTGEDIPLDATIGDTYRVTNKEYRGGCYFLVAQKL